MADNRVSKERKKELEQMDPFQENMVKALDAIKTYQKQLILIGAAVVVVAVVFSSILYSFKKAENKASEILGGAMTVYAQSETPEKGFESVQKDFKTLFSDYANTVSGKLARVEFAKICYEASRFDLSREHYLKALDQLGNKANMENFLLSSLGHVSMAQNDMKAAEKYFKEIESSRTDLLKDEAQFMLALISEKSGLDMEAVKKRYKKIVSEYPDSIYYPVADSKKN